jgi:cyclopropane fatty-acyl-phospholipid synthase-like methyltransferase
MSKDHFAEKAASYEQNQERVDNVAQIATALCNAVALAKTMHLMDFGSGTGLLLERLAPYVAKITAVDASVAMQAQLHAKLDKLACPVEQVTLDLESGAVQGPFDGIVSSMTLHHIKDVPALLSKLHGLLAPEGFLAIADLDLEDGMFHSVDTGVHHAGFERDALVQLAKAAGFRDVAIGTASRISKHGQDYPVFLLTARRSEFLVSHGRLGV